MPRCHHVLLLLLLAVVAGCQAVHSAATTHRHGPDTYEGYMVHVIFSNHLDVGFTDLDSKVVDLYFHKHFPHAAQLVKDVAASGNNTHGDIFRYLSHSWLLSLFFDCPPNMGWSCPNATELEVVEAAIRDGHITWHAMPFNPQYEVFDPSLLRFAVDFTHTLDAKFGKPPTRMVSLRDVPGLTRAAIPILASRGVQALTVGVNGFSAPPGVPKTTPFIWLDEQTGRQLLAMWHPGGYAGVRADGLHIDSHGDCIRAPGLKHVLCASWGDDNLGPPLTADDVLAMLAHVRAEWPGAKVFASTLEDYLDGLQQALAGGGITLPVVTGELGDTWIHGVASDPAKMADYRAAVRARAACEQQAAAVAAAATPATPAAAAGDPARPGPGPALPLDSLAGSVAVPGCDVQSPEFFNFSRLLMKVPEHTWGVSFNQYFGDFTNYTNAWLHTHLLEGEEAHPGLAMSLESWRRQRRYIDWALEALPSQHPIVAAVASDRAARHAATAINSGALLAAGAVAVLQQGRGGSRSGAGSRCAALAATGAAAAAAAAGGDGIEAGGGEDDRLLFCSDTWLVEVNRHTGGLTRLQRMYGSNQEDPQLGNDWAGGSAQPQPDCQCPPAGSDHHQQRHHHSEHEHQHSQLQQQQPAEPSQAASPAWWLQLLRRLAAALGDSRTGGGWQQWLPSPGAAAAGADFAVGDEGALYAGAAAAPAAAAGGDAATAAAGTSAAGGPAGSGGGYWHQLGRTSAYRRLLAVRDGIFGAYDDSSIKHADQHQHQQEQLAGAHDAVAGSRRWQSCDSTSGRSSRVSSHDDPNRCCRATPAFAELQYDVYRLQDYDFVWDNYAYIHPVWEGDFGKWNLSASSNLSATAKPRLLEAFDQSSPEAGLLLHLELEFPCRLVRMAGAPARAWLVLQAPPGSSQLQVQLVWQNKTATRLPEALWLRFRPGQGAVDEGSWLMHKLEGAISPSEILLNGSHALHAVSATGGVQVSSAGGREMLAIRSVDAPLVNLGAPNPLPNPCSGPDMREGVSFNPVNNIWGTNYQMWSPYEPRDANLAFRWTLEAWRGPDDVDDVDDVDGGVDESTRSMRTHGRQQQPVHLAPA